MKGLENAFGETTTLFSIEEFSPAFSFFSPILPLAACSSVVIDLGFGLLYSVRRTVSDRIETGTRNEPNSNTGETTCKCGRFAPKKRVHDNGRMGSVVIF